MSLRLLAWVVLWEWVMSSEFETGMNHIVSANSKILSQNRGMRRRLKRWHWWNEELSHLFLATAEPTILFSSFANFMSHCLPTGPAGWAKGPSFELRAPLAGLYPCG